MAGKRDKPEEIVLKLRQVEVLQGQGSSTADAVRQIGVTQQTYYRWRKEYGGMSILFIDREGALLRETRVGRLFETRPGPERVVDAGISTR